MRLLVALVLVLVLSACAVTFDPDATTPPPGVTLTAVTSGDQTLYQVTNTAEPIGRLFLHWHGEGLNANAPECDVTPASIGCTIKDVQTSYQITVAGDVQNDPSLPYGVVCRADCWALYLTQP